MGLTFLLTPVFIHYLGFEAYGLIGFFVLVQGILMILEFGIPLSLNRAISRLRAEIDSHSTISSILKTFELVFITLAILIVLFIALPSSYLSDFLFTGQDLDQGIISISIFLIILQFV